LSIQAVVGEQADFNLQRTDPVFTDSNNEYYDRFERQLEAVSARNSETKLCIEKFLEKSEKEWFGQRHNAKLGKSNLSTPAASLFRVPKVGEADVSENSHKSRRESDTAASLAQFDLGKDFMPFKGMKRIMQLKIGDWQVYTILLAFVSDRSPEKSHIANESLGTNPCRKLIPNQLDHWRKQSSRQQAVCRRIDLLPCINFLVDNLPLVALNLGPSDTVRILRCSILLPWNCTLRV
jgi:hypothetical protein